MSYIEQRAGRNQRVATMTIVAVIQGTAIVALVNGLAVKWMKPAPEPVTQATDVPDTTITLPPPEPMPSAHPRPDPVPVPVPTFASDSRPKIPTPVPTAAPDPIAVPTGDVVLPNPFPSPSPSPLFTPRSAKPRNAPGSWASTDDYPASDLRSGHQGVTRFTLSIGADGRVLSCAIARSSGFPGLDKATCDKVSQRARFDPATDNTGSRVAGTYTGSIRWQIPGE
jgi:protein TonB